MPYKDPEVQAEFMRRWRIRKQIEREQLEKGYSKLYHDNIELNRENLELKKRLKETQK